MPETYSSGSNIFLRRTERDCIACGILGLALEYGELLWIENETQPYTGSVKVGGASVLASFCISA